MHKMRSFSVLLLIFIFLFQSMVLSVTYASEDNNAVLGIEMPTISLMALTVTDSSAELVWVSKDNNINIASYDIYRDDNVIKTTNSFTFTDIGLYTA